jgi:hypothetical protein
MPMDTLSTLTKPAVTPATTNPLSTPTSIGTTAATLALASLGTFLATHGLMNSSGTEALVSLAPFVVAAGLAGWREWVRPILTAQLDVLKAKSLAQSAALKAANLPKVTVAQIAAQSPTMDVVDVAKAVATLPPEIKANVAGQPAAPASQGSLTGSSVFLFAILSALALAWASPADAQNKFKATGDIIKDVAATKAAQPGQPFNQTTADDLLNKLDKLALPDFEFALAQAQATNNVVTMPCWQAWIDLITARQKAQIGPDGNPMPLPDPHLITGIERISELLGILRPDSKISLACVQIAATAKQDVALFVTSIVTGGALGLFKLPIPLGPIP